MGFCSWLCKKVKGAWDTTKNIAKKVVNTVKNVAKKAVDTVVEAVTHPVETMKRVWNGTKKVWEYVTGEKARKISEEARKIYDDARKKYDTFVAQYEKDIDALNVEMCNIVERINQKKEYIIDVLFVKLQAILSKIKYEKYFVKECELTGGVPITKIEYRNNVLKIDFKANPIKSRLKAIFTLGFWANKLANESLDEAKNEAKKMEDSESRMRAEEKRYRLIKEALANTLKYLEGMIELYERILFKANNAASLLRFKCIQFTHTVSERYCKLESLPKADQDLLYGLFNLSKILNTVAKMHLTAASDEKEIRVYNEEMAKNNMTFMAAA